MKKNVRLPVSIRPERYKVTLKPDLKNFTFEGEETIQIILDKPSQDLTLHALDLEIESASLTNGKSSQTPKKISLSPREETVKFSFTEPIPRGKAQLNIKFKGILNDKMRGFYRSKYHHNGEAKYLATTQFESTDARRAIPCFDEPSHKAIFDVSLIIPKELTAISNTYPSRILEHETGYQIVEFAPTPKMSTYLLAFIVGDFEWLEEKTKEGILVRVFVTPGKKKQAEFALDVAIKALSFFNDYFGIPYPLEVMDLIAIPDFSAGAMENWGAVTYRETALLVDPDQSSTANKQWVAIVIAHELAHMWFGNLVTMEWWTHLWLNEGFASYIEYLATDNLFPEWDLWTQFLYLDHGSALELDSLKNTHPVEVEVHHPSEIGEIFDRISYSKGASIIRMLANYLGPKAFRDGLRYYLKKHRYSNASTIDLWKAFEHSSKKPVRKIMKNWTGKPGYPLLTLSESKNRLNVKQERFFSSNLERKTSKDTTLWSIPLRVISPDTKKVETILMDKKQLSLPVSKKANWVKLNGEESSFIRVAYPEVILEALKEPLEGQKLGTLDRLGIIRDSFNLAESGVLSTDLALKLALSYLEEDNYTVWLEVASSLSKLDSLLYGEDFYESYQKFAKQIFSKIVSKVGWQKRKGETHTETLLRSLILRNAGSYGHQEIVKEAQKIFKYCLSKNIKPEADLRGVIYGLVAENGGGKEFNLFKSWYSKETLQEEKDRIGRAITAFKDPKVLEKTLEFSLSKDVRLQDQVFLIYAASANPAGREITWEFIKKNWAALKTQFGGGHFLLTRVVQAASHLVKVSDAKDVEAFFKKNPTPDVKRTLAQAIEQIYSIADWLKRDREKIRELLTI